MRFVISWLSSADPGTGTDTIEEGHLGFLFGGRFDFNGDNISEIVFRGLRTGDASSGNHTALNIYFGGEIRPPEIKKAKFKKASSKLVVIGTDFTGASQIEINGLIIDREVKFVPDKSRLILKGKKRDLNLRSGQNQVRIIRKEARSNTVTLKL